jgi:hyperosmotically inducible periplasmic protein
MKAFSALALAVLFGTTTAAFAEKPDAWVHTKAKIALLTTDGTGRTAVEVDTDKGKVTLRGKVETQAEKAKAESVVRGIEGVKEVRNLIVVVPESQKKAVKATDAEIKDKIEASLKANDELDDVKVTSVDKGVVLLGGETKTLSQKLAAIEVAYKHDGVTRVASDIKTGEN